MSVQSAVYGPLTGPVPDIYQVNVAGNIFFVPAQMDFGQVVLGVLLVALIGIEIAKFIRGLL